MWLNRSGDHGGAVFRCWKFHLRWQDVGASTKCWLEGPRFGWLYLLAWEKRRPPLMLFIRAIADAPGSIREVYSEHNLAKRYREQRKEQSRHQKRWL